MTRSEIIKAAELITFTPDDLALLRASADVARTTIQNTGCHFESYQEKRHTFAREWMEGRAWHTEKSLSWAQEIKRELAEMRKRHAAHAARGESASQQGGA